MTGSKAPAPGAGLRPLIVPRWVAPSAMTLAAIGVAMAAYLTYEHYSAGATLACPENGTISCAKVTTSTHAVFFGAPVAVLGLLYFLAAFALVLPAAWRARGSALRQTRLLTVIAGAVSVVYLIWAELFAVGALCLWCTAVHVDMVALFAVVLFGDAFMERVAPADFS